MQKIPFRLRGREVTRVEAFSDVVFGFALTLIVVSLEVPATMNELLQVMRGFLGFAICFATLTWVWHVHHTFFRRYAMTDEITIALNTALLFVVLFYIYPLKFMFSVITGQIRATGNASTLFVIYGLGFAGIFLIYLFMYLHAWSRRTKLELNVLEEHDTITMMYMYGSYVLIGLASVLIGVTATRGTLKYAGLIYFMLGPVSAAVGYWRGSQRHSLQVQMTESTTETEARPAPNSPDTIPAKSPESAIVTDTP